jgi:hypothetical protein
VLAKISSIAFVFSIIEIFKAFAALPSLTQFATVFHLPASSSALLLSYLTLTIILDFFDGQATSSGYHLLESQEKF